jgi:TonB family protein
VRFDGEVKTAQLPGGRFVSRISVDSEFLNALSPATELIIATRYGEPLAFHLTGSDTATAALKACEGDLLKSWGVDPARFIALIPPGKPGFVDLSQYIGGDDYPRAANGANGEVLALLTIGLDGKITGCRTIESSGNDALDQRTCEIARRIHYSVALDQDKKPVSSWTVFKVHWYFSNS